MISGFNSHKALYSNLIKKEFHFRIPLVYSEMFVTIPNKIEVDIPTYTNDKTFLKDYNFYKGQTIGIKISNDITSTESIVSNEIVLDLQEGWNTIELTNQLVGYESIPTIY